ncbi:MAG: hypothetical protein COA96_17015 [SAR86 cluster bacterium]|uniref:Uncharacterized protein n=1 Tax=SAR86 cluster bacterium TaxID=2030880 RepID=A0A2A5AGE0_9GAMM|nr:MAG: hypothetical protein COA96_17015 [SAR86 cluster bacterium]
MPKYRIPLVRNLRYLIEVEADDKAKAEDDAMFAVEQGGHAPCNPDADEAVIDGPVVELNDDGDPIEEATDGVAPEADQSQALPLKKCCRCRNTFTPIKRHDALCGFCNHMQETA